MALCAQAILKKCEDVARWIKMDGYHSWALRELLMFLEPTELKFAKAAMLVEMGIVPVLVHILKTAGQATQDCEDALVLLHILVVESRDKLAHFVDVNLVRTLIAKLHGGQYVAIVSSALASIAACSKEHKQMLRNNGIMEAILAVASTCRDTDDFSNITSMVSVLFLSQASVGRRTKREFFCLTLFGVHGMFENGEFEDSPEALRKVLPLMTYLLNRSPRDFLDADLALRVLADFFHQPMYLKDREVVSSGIIPVVVELLDAPQVHVVSLAMSCVRLLARSGVTVTAALLGCDVVQKLYSRSDIHCHTEPICYALYALLHSNPAAAKDNMELSACRWAEWLLLSRERNIQLAACTVLVGVARMEGHRSWRIFTPLETLVEILCHSLQSPKDDTEADSVLDHLQVCLDVARQRLAHRGTRLLLRPETCINLLQRYVTHGNMCIALKAQALVKTIEDADF